MSCTDCAKKHQHPDKIQLANDRKKVVKDGTAQAIADGQKGFFLILSDCKCSYSISYERTGDWEYISLL